MTLNFLKVVYIFLMISIIGCQPQPTLQTYFVDHQEIPSFISMDIPISFLDADKLQLTKNQENAINSIQKLNMLGYSLKSGSEEIYDKEVRTIKTLLKSSQYNELMRMGNSKDGRIQISYVGDEEAVEELIIFGTSSDYGFAVIRVLGRKMNLSNIVELGPIINKLDTSDMNVEGFLDYML